MTDELNPEALAAHIVEKAKAEGIRAEVKVNQIPQHIAANILVFLERVQCTGPEAFAWVEAVQYIRQFVPQPPQGVPFTGLPQQKKA